MASPKSMIITELRVLLRLTETEIQVAETRRAQARTEAVERELAENADNGRLRATAIATVLREEGGAPDVVTAAAGRLGAVAKSTLEQGRPFTEALLGDLALEHQLQDRARLLKALGSAAGRPSVVALADRLVDAHGATVRWLTVVLAEVALGGPPALRPTPVQTVVGAGLSLARIPGRRVSRCVDSLLGQAGRAVDQAWQASQEDAEDLDDLQERATTAVRRTLAPNVDRLPVVGYGRLTKPLAIAAVKGLSTPADVRAVLAYEESHRKRADVVSAAQVRLADIARAVISGHARSDR